MFLWVESLWKPLSATQTGSVYEYSVAGLIRLSNDADSYLCEHLIRSSPERQDEQRNMQASIAWRHKYQQVYTLMYGDE